MALARVVVRRRKQLGLSQERFAFKAEIDRRHMAEIEAGRATVPLRMLKRLAEGFGLHSSQLLQEVEREERQSLETTESSPTKPVSKKSRSSPVK
jgi:transcriptional regulator with XRE-family HTH domain